MPPDYDVALEDQIRECYGRAIYTHKTHERMADRCADTLRKYKLLQITLSAFTSAGAVSVVLRDETWIELATAFVAVLTLFVAAYLKNFDPGSTAQKHRDAAAKLWNVRECYFSLLTDLPKLSYEAAVERREELQSMLAGLYAGTPQTDGRAYLEAQDRLKNMEDMTFTDEEIDCFLPLSLKRSGGRSKQTSEG